MVLVSWMGSRGVALGWMSGLLGIFGVRWLPVLVRSEGVGLLVREHLGLSAGTLREMMIDGLALGRFGLR